MIIAFAVVLAVFLGLLIAMLFNNKKLESKVAAANQESERLRQHYESETRRVYNEAQAAVAEAQKQIDQQFAEIKEQAERARQHYETEARKSQKAADALLSKTIKDFEPLRKYQGLRDAETEVQRQLADAIKEATSLRAEAQTLLEQSRNAATDVRATANEKADDIREQADARLNQAIRDAGRMIADAEKRAEQIGGDAYTALRDKLLLEQAAEAIRNVIEGYGDRYLVPTHSILDDFAEQFGYDEAGKALKSAREQSRRMVEQGEAATCDYTEANRRKTAIQFVIVAFNGYVDSILSRVKHDNYGTLEQKIRDAFSLVNLNGNAFRAARILQAYLDARLAELKWAAKVQDLVLRLRDEQRAIRDEMRDIELAKREQEEKLREAARVVELKEMALKEAEGEIAKKIADATDEQKKQYEDRLQKLRQELDEATQKGKRIPLLPPGKIYIISNEGSFGPGVYKIGFTRREAQKRVEDLYNASVPFGFEIHAVITTENARALEYKLHRQFLAMRMNKMNFHKEFFRVDLNEIRQEVGKLTQGKDFTGTPQWRETEAGRVAQWQESRDIENDSQRKDKWLKDEQALADERWLKRERRLARRGGGDALVLSVSDDLETEADDSPALEKIS
jgi:Meiotically Up-regulated Gene 113 (MUG113) protein/uncharacterized protein DUF4041